MRNDVVGVLGVLLGAAMTAGVGAPSAGAEEAMAIEEVIVTARKRSQALQDVPLAVTALSQNYLNKLGADDFMDYAMTVPGMSFVDKGVGARKVVLRGVSTGTDGERNPTVGVYIDELPVTAGGPYPDLKLVDVERVEVLRGPQGTLYGVGSMGGTLKIVTNKPHTDSFEGMVSGEVSTTRKGGESFSFDAMANVPMIEDKLAVRAVGYYRDEAGFIDNIALDQKDANDEEVRGGRLAARLNATENLTITGTVLAQNTDANGRPAEDILADGTPEYDEYEQFRLWQETLEDDFVVANVTLDYDFGWGDLVSSTSYFDRDRETFTDVSTFFAGFLGLPVVQNDFSNSEVWVEELRLSSKDDVPLQWLIGGFYYDQDEDSGQSFPSEGAPVGSGLENLGQAFTLKDEKQKAVFGELSYNVTDAFQLTAGLRWFKTKQNFYGENRGLLFGTPIDTDTPGIRSGAASSDVLNFKFLGSYEVSEDILLFAQAAEGFRQGGALAALPDNAVTGEPAPTQFDPDSIWNYEVGIKSTWLDNRLLFNLSAFYIDWTNIQTLVRREDGISYTGNGGEATSKGFELETSAQVTSSFNLRLSATYTKAQLSENAPLIGGLKGDQIPGVPKFSMNVGGEYRRSVSTDLDGFVRADLSYVGSTVNAFELSAARPSFDQDSYALVNMRVGVSAEGWSVTAFVENLFDTNPSLYVETLLPGVIQKNTLRPRTFGLSARTRF